MKGPGDGLVATDDGALLIAQVNSSLVIRLDRDDKASVFLANTNRAGSLAIDRRGRVLAVHRMPQPGAANADAGPKNTSIGMLAPERRVVADLFADGSPWTGRPNDLAGDNAGGAYFTQGCLYHAGASGRIVLVAGDLFGNGIVLSPDGDALRYELPHGRLIRRRRSWPACEPTRLRDARGQHVRRRIRGRCRRSSVRYVGSHRPGLQPDRGASRVIPTPRSVVSVAFAGADRKTLYVIGNGADGPDGKPVGGGARTIYKLPMLAQGISGRGK